MKRPQLDINLSSDEFEKWYWYKKELDQFCRTHGLPISHKQDEEKFIKEFLKTGKKTTIKNKKTLGIVDSAKGLSLNAKVVNYKNDVLTREFFIKEVEKLGYKFTGFSAHLNKWRKTQTDITYEDLIKKYIYFLDLKKSGSLPHLSRQVFQFNAYVSDALKDGLTRNEAIELWKQCIQKAGSPVYKPKK